MMLSKSSLLFFAFFCYFLPQTYSATDTVVCYFSSWAVYRPDKGVFKPEDIDATICTHVYYAFMGLEANGSIKILDTWSEIDLGGLRKTNDLKKINPKLKLVASVGGWNAGNAILTTIAKTPAMRANLARSSIDFFKKYGFDGLDIDWEYPTSVDKANFITLLKELKAAFSPGGYIVTAAVSAIPIDDAYDIPGMASNLDLINLMTYDFHVAGAGVTGQNSPLYAGSSDNAWQKDYENVNASVVQWIKRGANPQKLTIGLAFYGHTFTLSSSDHKVGAKAIGPGSAGPYTKNNGTLGYNEICANDWTKVWDDQQKVPYKFKANQWVGYDDEQSIGLKTQFAKSQKLAGVMIWTVDTDDFHGLCGPAHGLLQAIKKNL